MVSTTSLFAVSRERRPTGKRLPRLQSGRAPSGPAGRIAPPQEIFGQAQLFAVSRRRPQRGASLPVVGFRKRGSQANLARSIRSRRSKGCYWVVSGMAPFRANNRQPVEQSLSGIEPPRLPQKNVPHASKRFDYPSEHPD